MSEARHLAGALRGLFSEHGWFPAFKVATNGLTSRQAVMILDPGYYSVWQLTNHVRFNAELLFHRIHELPIDWAAMGAERSDGWPPQGHRDDQEAWEKDRNRAIEANERLADAVTNLNQSQLERPITQGGSDAIRLVHGLIAHDSYHTGQMVLVRRLKGTWDIKWRERVG